MTVEINYAIAIAKLSDWFKNLAPAFLASSKLQVIARNSDWHWYFKKSYSLGTILQTLVEAMETKKFHGQKTPSKDESLLFKASLFLRFQQTKKTKVTIISYVKWSKTNNENNRTNLIWIDVFYESFQGGHEAGGQMTILKKHPLPTLHSGSHHSFSTRALKTVNYVPMEFSIQQSSTVTYAPAKKWMCFKYMQQSSFKLTKTGKRVLKQGQRRGRWVR